MKHVSDRGPYCLVVDWINKAGESAKIRPGLALGGYVFILFWSLSSGGQIVNGRR
jgi:hypothetical protein